jgi:hypothetical protein
MEILLHINLIAGVSIKKNVFHVDSCSIDTLKIELDEKYLYQKRIATVVVIYTLRRFKGRKEFSRKYQTKYFIFHKIRFCLSNAHLWTYPLEAKILLSFT